MPQTAIRVYRHISGEVPLSDWLSELKELNPRAYAKCLARIQLLGQYGYELRRPIADTLRDGIYELRAKDRHVNYRILYFFCGQSIVCLSHGFTKEDEIPDAEIDSAITRMKLVEKNIGRFTVEWER